MQPERLKTLRRWLGDYVLPSAACFAIAFTVAQTPWGQHIQNLALDARTRWRANFQPPSDPRVAVIGIDDSSLEAIGRWPWRRAYHGQFLQLAAKAKASVVAWDILFTEPDTIEPDNDTALVNGALLADLDGTSVVFGGVTNATPGSVGLDPQTKPITRIEGDVSKLHHDAALLGPIPGLQDIAHMALVDAPPGPDGVRRWMPLVARAGDRVYFSLAMQSLLRFWQVKPEEVLVRLGDAIYIKTPNVERRIPINEAGLYRVNYRFGLEGSNTLAYVRILAGLDAAFNRNARPPDLPDLSNRILLVGQISTALTDFGPTPFSGFTPLVLVHANVLENILREDYVHETPTVWVLLGATLVGAVGLALFSGQRLAVQIAFFLGFPVVYGAISTYAWIQSSLRVPFVWPVLGFAGLQIFMISRRLLQEQRAKAQIKGMFGTYISPDLVNRMVESGETPRLGGHELEITAYFSDIQGYSGFSERLSPAKLVELLNEYLTACTDIVQEEGGTLDKYIGDAVVAMFGAPIALPDHAYRACVAALRVQSKLDELRAIWDRPGSDWPEGVRKMRSRIGLNTGPAIIGNMGSRTRFNYTMTGDNVNLAARMESGAKSWGVYTMVTEATRAECRKHDNGRVIFRTLGKIQVMGRSQGVPIYEAVGLKESLAPATAECIGLFEQGLAKYYDQDWPAAEQFFERSSVLEPNQPGKSPGVKNNPSLVYLDIVKAYRERPPPADWDGVYVMLEK